MIMKLDDRQLAKLDCCRGERSATPWSHEDVVHLQRLAVVGELCAETAHEVNQPLAAVKWFAEAAVNQLQAARERGEIPSEQLTELLGTIAEQADVAQRLNSRLFGMARRSERETQPFPLREVWQSVEPLLRVLASRYQVDLTTEGLDDLPNIAGDRLQIGQVLLNVVRNAIEAVALAPSDRRRVVIRASRQDGMAVVEVRDWGEGACDEVLAKIFDRFFTTRQAGTGLGLAITKSIVEEHGGEIEVKRNPDFGLTFRLHLPLASARQD